MPEMGGVDATRLIRRDLPREFQPVIVALTADAFQENRERCLAAGMDDVLTKPIQRTQLADTIRRLLERRVLNEP